MSAPEDLAAVVEQMPKPGKHHGSKEQTEQRAERVIARLAESPAEAARGLVALIEPPEEGGDEKARYALHALGVHLAGTDKKQRRRLSEALASTLDGEPSVEVKKYVIRELETSGGPEVVVALGRRLADPELCEPAAQALLAIGGDGVVEQFRAALPKTSGPSTTTIVQALGVLRDEKSVPALQNAAGSDDRDTRLAAVWGLANIGDAGSVDAVLKAADSTGYERIKATKACLVLAERLLEQNKKDAAAKIYRHLRQTRTDPSEAYVREIAERGLAKAG